MIVIMGERGVKTFAVGRGMLCDILVFVQDSVGVVSSAILSRIILLFLKGIIDP